jgi:hypothetical protein
MLVFARFHDWPRYSWVLRTSAMLGSVTPQKSEGLIPILLNFTNKVVIVNELLLLISPFLFPPCRNVFDHCSGAFPYYSLHVVFSIRNTGLYSRSLDQAAVISNTTALCNLTHCSLHKFPTFRSDRLSLHSEYKFEASNIWYKHAVTPIL